MADGGDEGTATPTKPASEEKPDAAAAAEVKTPDTADCSKFVDAVFKPVFQAA